MECFRSYREALVLHWAPQVSPNTWGIPQGGTPIPLGPTPSSSSCITHHTVTLWRSLQVRVKEAKQASFLSCLGNGCCFLDFATQPRSKTACFAFLTQVLQGNIIKRAVRNSEVFWWIGQLLIFFKKIHMVATFIQKPVIPLYIC